LESQAETRPLGSVLFAFEIGTLVHARVSAFVRVFSCYFLAGPLRRSDDVDRVGVLTHGCVAVEVSRPDLDRVGFINKDLKTLQAVPKITKTVPGMFAIIQRIVQIIP